MRILVVTNMFPPHHFGGYELSCLDAARRFVALGHQVTVLTSDLRVEGVEGGEDDGVPVRRELEMYWQDHQLTSPPLFTRFRMEMDNQRSLRRAIEEVRPDVVSVWNMGALSLSLLSTIRATGLPVVFVIGDDWPNYAPALDAWSRLFTGRRRSVGRVISAVTGVPTSTSDFSDMGPCLFNSRAMRDEVRRGGRWSMPITGIVFTGFDQGVFPVRSDDEPVEERPWAGHLLYVGRIDRRKGIATAVDALSALPDSDLHIVGSGDHSYLAELEERIALLGVENRVRFSASTRAGLAAIYAASDVLVFSSVYQEPFGIVPLEAMACDLPVVATGTGGSGEYLRDGFNCLLYPPGEHEGLVRAVQRLSDDAALRQTLVRGGRRTARGLTTDAWLESLVAWHEAVANRDTSGLPADRQVDVGLPQT